MDKIKSLIQTYLKNYLDMIRVYKVTMVWILATSLITAVFIEREDAVSLFLVNKGIVFAFLCGVGSYFSETFFRDSKAKKWAGIAAACLIAAGLTAMTNAADEMTTAYAVRIIITYGIVILMSGVWKNWKRSMLPFNEYCIRAVYRLCQTAVITGIVSHALALVTMIFVILLLDAEQFELIFRAEILVVGCLTGGGILAAQIQIDQKPARFFEILIRILLGMLELAFVIVYIYILRIIITRIVPSNEIFRILAGLFILGLPVWTVAGALHGTDLLSRIGEKLPFVFIPFLFLQGYALGARIAAYGMTPVRYTGIVLMLFEVIYIAVYSLKAKETGVMLPVIAVMSVFAIVMPGINMFSVSVRSQKSILDKSLGTDFSQMSFEDQSRAAGAYFYLESTPEGENVLKMYDPESLALISESGMIGDPDYDRGTHIFMTFPFSDVDISGFSKMTWVESRVKDETVDVSEVEFYDTEDNIVLRADLEKYIDECLHSAGGIPEVIEIGNGQIIRVLTLSLTADGDGTLELLNISGILLSSD